MQPDLSPSEQFLAGFHDANPGVTSRAFDSLAARMSGRAFALACNRAAPRPQ